eukprot:1656793-Rhodomonas_salina.3
MQSRYTMLFLHQERSAATVKEILERGFARSEVRPAILRSDGAGEYGDEGLENWLLMLGINHQWSLPERGEARAALGAGVVCTGHTAELLWQPRVWAGSVSRLWGSGGMCRANGLPVAVD